MTEDTVDEYDNKLQKTREVYFKIGRILCPCLNNEYVYFKQLGFRHILRKGKAIRPIADQMRRFAIFPLAATVVSSKKSIIAEIRYKRIVTEYALTLLIRNQTIKVVVRKNATSDFQFVSIMN